jgi:hypothetical protein
VSHPQNFFEGCKDFQSLIPRCPHSVFRPLGDLAGKSSMCEICNSETEREVGVVRRPLTEKQAMKATRQIEKVVPPIDDDRETKEGEIFEEDPQEIGGIAETDFVEEDQEAEERFEAEEIEVGD